MSHQYDIEQLIAMIAGNSLNAIYAKLVQEGKVSPNTVPDVSVLGAVIDEQSKRLSTEQFLGWLEGLLDVPLDQQGLYYSELSALKSATGRTPAKVLADQMREQLPSVSTPGTPAFWGGAYRMNWLSWLLLILAVIGAVCVLRFAARLIGKITD